MTVNNCFGNIPGCECRLLWYKLSLLHIEAAMDRAGAHGAMPVWVMRLVEQVSEYEKQLYPRS